VVVYAVVDISLSPTSPLGDSIDTFVRRQDAEQFSTNVKRDDRSSQRTFASSSVNSRPTGATDGRANVGLAGVATSGCY
jgi:hypothetical protein